MVRVAERPFGCDALGQHSLAILQRNPAQVIPVDIDQVEDVIQDGNFSSGSHMPAMLPDAGSLLHQAERSPPLFIQSDELTIQKQRLHMYSHLIIYECHEFSVLNGMMMRYCERLAALYSRCRGCN